MNAVEKALRHIERLIAARAKERKRKSAHRGHETTTGLEASR